MAKKEPRLYLVSPDAEGPFRSEGPDGNVEQERFAPFISSYAERAALLFDGMRKRSSNLREHGSSIEQI